MACRVIGDKTLPELMPDYCWFEPYEQISVIFKRNSYILLQEKPFENVDLERAVMLSQPHFVNSSNAST